MTIPSGGPILVCRFIFAVSSRALTTIAVATQHRFPIYLATPALGSSATMEG